MAEEKDEIIQFSIYIPESVREEIRRVQAEMKEETPFKVSLGQAVTKIVREYQKNHHAGK